jgi:uncharacterized protein (TIGR01777 family)
MRVAVTGSHGTIGSALVHSLEADGHEVVRVVRGAPTGANELRLGDALDGIDAVVNLAGEPVEKRWTPDQKRKVLASRVDTTKAIAHAIATATNGPKVLVSGSAIGFYGDTHGDVVDETGPTGDDFLAEVVRQWEAATAEAEAAGVRVVHARTGIVQTAKGGALKRQLLPFKLGLGGKIGDGKFWVSWISLDDEVRALRFALDNESISGPVNLTAPNPVTNADYTKALGAALHRPTVAVIPKAALKVALGGELVDTLLTSQRVIPQRLLDAGFVFHHPDIAEGMKAAVEA